MYAIDDLDEVVEIRSMPQCSIGAPIPAVLASEDQVFLVYYVENPPENWDGKSVRVVDAGTTGEPIAIVGFDRCHAHMFGPPNDEAFDGHPLEPRGLSPYGIFEIRNSSWIRSLEKMNSVHPEHCAQEFDDYKHYVFAFHDSTFECVANGLDVTQSVGSISSALARLAESID